MPGHRNMYYATGLPGWMRFGFSPGWVGRSPTGLGPCATYLMTGSWGMPQVPDYQDGMVPGFAQGPGGPFMGAMSREVELAFLKQHAELLAGRVEAINKRIQQLEEEEQ